MIAKTTSPSISQPEAAANADASFVVFKRIVVAVALSTAAVGGVTQLPPEKNALSEVVAAASISGDIEQPAARVVANYPPSDEEIRQMYDAEFLDPIDLNVPAIATDKGVRYDYDIVYVRAPRFGDEGKSTWAEVSRPHVMDAGADLMLLRPDGSEELLVAGGKGSVADPMVSFDGEWVYYSKFHDLTDKHGPGGGSDIYKIHVKSQRIVKLTDFGFAPNMGLPGQDGEWSTGFTKHEQDRLHLEHALYNLGPCPLPGGKVMFVSNRHGFRPPKSPGGGMPTLQLFTLDDSDDGPGANVECIGFLNVACALHPVVLMDGRVMFSSMESEGLRTQLEWGLWTIHPDGTQWNPLVSAFATEGGAVNSFHFQTQISDGSIVVEEYYVGSNFGMGTLRKCSPSPPNPPQPSLAKGGSWEGAMFGPAYRQDRRNPPLRTGRHSNGKPSMVRLPFSPYGMTALTPFTTGSDWAADPSVRDDENSMRVGKFTHPCGAPDNHMLVVWTPGSGHTQRSPQADGGIYLIKDGQPIDEPAQMRLIKNDPQFNEQWPRALVPYNRTYGIDQPKQLATLKNDGSVSPHLPAGSPFGLIGTSSLYKRETYPDGVVPEGSVTATYHERDGDAHQTPWRGLDATTSHGNGITTNWANQGGDAGLYSNDEIHAIRILLQEPTSAVHEREFSNHANERLRVLGEIPVRKFHPLPVGEGGERVDSDTPSPQPSPKGRGSTGGEPLDPDGNPDTSFLAKIPADVPFTFQTIDKHGMVLNSAQTWHQVRPGEVRHDCGGCHAHSQQPTAFELTAAAKPDYKVFDLTQKSPLVTARASDESKRQWDAADETGVRYHEGPLDVEYYADIAPIFERSCIHCHSEKDGKKPAAGLELDTYEPVVEADGRKWPSAYFRLALDNEARFGHKPPGWDSWGYYQASRYVRKLQSRRSLLMWKVLGKRTDGFTNDDHPSESKPGANDLIHKGEKLDLEHHRSRFDIDFVGTQMPPPEAVKAGKVPPLSDEETRTIARWIDLGCPIDLHYFAERPNYVGTGWRADENRPTLTVTYPQAGENERIDRILIGMHDAYTGLKPETLTVMADFEIDGVKPGENLAAKFKETSSGVWELKLAKPIEALTRGTLTVSVQDGARNLASVERSVSVP